MKKAISQALSLFLACLFVLSLGFMSVSADNAVPGDVNNDGELTIIDVLYIVKAVANNTAVGNSDVNGDGKTNLLDVINVIRLIATGEAPEVGEEDKSSADIVVENGTVKEAVSINGEKVSAAVPEGVTVDEGATSLTLSVTAMDSTNGNITPGETEDTVSYDVHIEGVSEENTVAIVVDLGAILPVGQNTGTVSLYHVENGTSVKMTQVMSLAELDSHNEFYYYPATGNVYVALATFSEIIAVNDTENPWDGTADHKWYDAEKKELIIANANQLRSFAEIVGGMAEGIERDSFKGKTVTLVADVDLGDAEANNRENIIFYPIGYWNEEGTYEKTNKAVDSDIYPFEGTFDGAGHTVANFYQNTWEMKGDNEFYDATLQYYRDAMGLFGIVYGGTVKNLTVKNFSSDGEYTTTGVIAAAADCGATFENIAIFNCNPRVYNIGNGGIVGCVGWYTNEYIETPVTFRNITVDNTNKISALWGSYDVSCGGIVGQYYPTSGVNSSIKNAGVHFDNCHVAAQMDVYNDVCGNYQYYAYRYAGILMGSVRENVTDENGHVYPKMDGITADNCTVHFGDWNDYYYCELVSNGKASYTHDHKMSRLIQVASVDVENKRVTPLKGDAFDVPTSGRANYVVVNVTDEKGFVHATENATCYHFLDGEVWNHEQGDYETTDVNGDGVIDSNVLKENNQHIYLEFNNLVTGYGWGVSTKAVGDMANVTILDREEANSVVKFTGLADGKKFTTGTTVTVGELFKAVDGLDEVVAIKGENVTVSVSPIGESTANGTYVADTDDWTKSTLTFTGIGAATITITDYYFCTPTEISIEVVDVQPVDKFKGETVEDKLEIGEDSITVTLGDLFTAVNDADIDSAKVTVTVTPDAAVTKDDSDWKNTMLTFGAGKYTVTVTDNNYCNEATATVIIAEPESVVKFTKKFTNENFLYRVGNQNAVKLGSLFETEFTGNRLGDVSVTVETIAGAIGTYTSNATWTNGEIKFSGTGVVKVTITDDMYCIPTELILEVVDAKNVTGAENATANNVVLLQDCGFGSLEVSGGYTLYGNGFTMTCGSDSAARDMSYSFVELNNGILDNVQIKCPDFSHAILYAKNYNQNGNPTDADGTRYYNIRSAVLSSGNSKILNSYVSGGRAAVYATGGTLLIDNSTIVGGAAANIHTGACALTLRNATLIQEPRKATVNDTSKTLMGLSVIAMCDGEGKCSPITLEGTLTQYAWAHEGYTQYVPADGQTLIPQVLKEDEYIHSITYSDGTTADSLNLGILFMPSDSHASVEPVRNSMVIDDRDNSDSMPYGSISVNGMAYVYSYKESNGTDESVKAKPSYTSNEQEYITPKLIFTDTSDARVFDTSFNATSGKWEASLKVDVDQGVYDFSFDNLLAQKYGQNLSYTITTVEGTTVDSDAIITLNDSITNEYVLTVTDNNIFDVNGEKTENSVTTKLVFKLLSTKTSIPAPEWVSKTLNGTPYIVVDSKDGDWNCAIPVLDGLSVKYYSNGKVTELNFSDIKVGNGLLNGSTNSYTYSEEDYTLAITTTGFKTNDNGKPVGVNNELYFTVSSSSNYVSTKTTDRTITVNYTFTDANNSEPITLKTTMTVTYSVYKSKQYNYAEFCNGKLEEASCVTPDTLVTLADGTQVRVDSLTGDEELLVWNLETGSFDSAPIMFVDSEAEEEFEIVHLYFSDGTDVKVIYEHGFFDYDLGRYVYLDANAAEYIGHTFAKQSGDELEKVTLTDVVIEREVTTAWSPVTKGHLCYFVNGILSMPGGVGGLFNIFDVDVDTMTYDFEKMAADIEEYGFFTYEELNAIEPLSEEMFNEAGGAYLKISIGKGNLTMDELVAMIRRYSKFF